MQALGKDLPSEKICDAIIAAEQFQHLPNPVFSRMILMSSLAEALRKPNGRSYPVSGLCLINALPKIYDVSRTRPS